MLFNLAFEEIPDIDFGDDINLDKAESLFMERVKLAEEKRLKKEGEIDENPTKRRSGMVI